MRLDDLPQPEKIKNVPPEQLEVDGDNPNEQSEEMFGLLCKNMRKKGWIGNHIVADTDGLIADGEHRWRAAKEIGLEEVPVKFYEIDDTQRRLWRQELNKISGEHDKRRDALEYKHLLDNGKSEEIESLVQATDEDLDELLAEIHNGSGEDPSYDYDPDHNVYFQDCVEGIRKNVEENSVDCVITDPTYGVDYEAGKHKNVIPGKDYKPDLVGDDIQDTINLWDDFLSEVVHVLKPGGHFYGFTACQEIPRLQPLVEKHLEWKNTLVWVKNNSTISPSSEDNYMWRAEFIFYAINGKNGRPLNSYEENVLEYDRPPSGEYEHPTQKPVQLLSFLTKQSTDLGDTILDPFMGSGTTAVAAIYNNQDYVGFEVDEENYKSVIERKISEAKRQFDMINQS